MNFKRILVIAAMLLIGAASESFAFRGGVIVPIPIPVPVAPAPVYYGPPEPVYYGPPAVVAEPYFYGGFWWWNNGGYWYRSHHRHGDWGRPYRGRIPHGVSHYSHDGDRHRH